jgi:hypothetical protein
MLKSFRHFRAGPDPFGRSWQVDLLWLQTATSIRHSDSVDVKFLLSDGETRLEKVIALHHPDLLELSGATGLPLTDPWCMRLAAQHLVNMIETGNDIEKILVTVKPEELTRYGAMSEPRQ